MLTSLNFNEQNMVGHLILDLDSELSQDVDEKMMIIHSYIYNMCSSLILRLIVGDSQQRWRCWRGVSGRPVTWRQISPSSPRLTPLWSEISQNSKL